MVLWQIAAVAGDSLYFPPPSEIAVRMYELWFSGPSPWFVTPALVADIGSSLGRMFAGWGIAVVLGVALGIAIGRSRVVSQLVDPIVHFLRSTPGPALIPVFLILLGTDNLMRISLIAFGSIWPVLLNSIDGVRAIDSTQLETGRAFGLPWRARIFRIVIPAAMPKIFAGIQVSLAVALVLMVISELTVSTDGIGHQLLTAQQTFALTDMWAGIALLAILGYLLNLGFTVIERRVLRWYRGARQHD
ncbi:ABC transporter permease [Cryobacterium sp. Y50]|uniref:ABC transporter permease n=1 Tax=Cryobacterium sp. Y50 TaxID=2048286 RepID=UPI0018EE1AC6|nr:ABC transporter permease [Cryobacterium sp. Y50]